MLDLVLGVNGSRPEVTSPAPVSSKLFLLLTVGQKNTSWKVNLLKITLLLLLTLDWTDRAEAYIGFTLTVHSRQVYSLRAKIHRHLS